MTESEFGFDWVAAQLRPGDVRYCEQVLRLHSGRRYSVREKVAILAVERDPVEPERRARVLGYSQATEGLNGDPGYRSYPARFGFGPTILWSGGDDPDSFSGQWWLGPNGLVGTYTPPGRTMTEEAEHARRMIAAREDMLAFHATHRHRRGGREAAAAKLAEEDAITGAAADRDHAVERLTTALRASSLPERKLAELSGLARATVRRIIGR